MCYSLKYRKIKESVVCLTNLTNETRLVDLKNENHTSLLFGAQDKHLALLEDAMDVVINSRGSHLEIIGTEENTATVEEIFNHLEELIKRSIQVGPSDVVTAIKMAKNNTLHFFISMYEEEIGKDHAGKPIRAKTFGQRQYIQSIKKNDVTFGVGPAGTGKTYLAVVMAVSAMKKGEVKKIILTRPAVEAGENLGFLPGDLKEKVDPYLRPIYDALYNVFGLEHTTRLMDRNVIEIAPLAYMRGRTLEDAFVILDEAQNTTKAQMKMFLTRLGFGSKMIVNGDVTQIDLPRGAMSGLVHAEKVLNQVKGINFVQFDSNDVVRHPVVANIINAYSQEKTMTESKKSDTEKVSTEKNN
ncbi:PhoH family protein [Carnobacterium inhibens]|uniref:PhoH-like protein n=1 Tax=Carnobacterium inhibens TaxID=147709 RepID=A0ABR7TA77_9LACT|nr:PhoH family protein [Carnobacterium inhibens]MBC9824849.1 AAA family ATPase [Carnobacterium inhibens]MCM3512537.1 PhoH family protein [Carnobacterium inhibens]